jgi:peroxiredoxin
MRRPRVRIALLALLALLAAAGAFVAPAPAARAEGWNLDGRMAPDMAFPGGVNGLSEVAKLSDLKGRVVWIKFWLRDCPICRKTLPALQEAHERWARAGLVVLAVIHGFPPADYTPFMRQNGYTFPVATDADGGLAALYGVAHRPVDFLVGRDGRVKSSNGVPAEALAEELGHYRLARLGRVGDALLPAREKVWQNDLAGALKLGAPLAAAADASEELKAAVGRIQTLGGEDIDARANWAAYLVRARRVAEARAEMDALVAAYAGTALAQRAIDARGATLPR